MIQRTKKPMSAITAAPLFPEPSAAPTPIEDDDTTLADTADTDTGGIDTTVDDTGGGIDDGTSIGKPPGRRGKPPGRRGKPPGRRGKPSGRRGKPSGRRGKPSVTDDVGSE